MNSQSVSQNKTFGFQYSCLLYIVDG